MALDGHDYKRNRASNGDGMWKDFYRFLSRIRDILMYLLLYILMYCNSIFEYRIWIIRMENSDVN